MTAKTTVTIEAVYPDGTDLTNRRVVVQLIHGGAGGTVDGELIAERTTVPLTGAGPWSIALYPTAAISPSGCFYRFTIDNSSPTINRDISVPSSGPVSWTDAAILLENPEPPVTIPAAVSGTAGQVLGVVDPGDGPRYDLIDQTGGVPDTTGAAEYAIYTVITPGEPAVFSYDIPALLEEVQGVAAALSDTTGTTAGDVLTVTTPGSPPVYAAPTGGASGVFGSGIDGALVLDGTSAVTGFTRSGTVYTPTRDILATDLTVNSGVTLDLRTSWRLYANGTFSNAGTIRSSGKSAGGSGAPTANNWGSLGRGGSAGAGATGAGSASAAFDNSARSKLAGNGGNGGLGSSGAGGTAAVAASIDHNFGQVYGFHTVPGCVSGYTIGNGFGNGTVVQLAGGGGGAGGGGDGTNAGGGGGAGGNPILIVARYFVNTGTITADGGDGHSPTTGNCGGGGGGGAGPIIISYSTYSNSGTITANGGAGGTKVGTGVNGTAGGNGTIVLVAL